MPLSPATPQKRYVKVLVGLLIVLLSGTLLLGILLGGWCWLFSKNEHFTLKHIQVQGSGWWKGRDAEIVKVLSLRPGETNLFSLDLAALRKELSAEPSIESVTMERLMPDTLIVRITERIPRAFLNSRNSGLLLDSSGMVLAKDSCLNIDRNLPVIVLGARASHIIDPKTGKPPELKPGMQLPELKPALELLLLSLTDFTDLKISGITFKTQDELFFLVYFKERAGDVYKVYVPVTGLRNRLDKLIAALIDIKRRHSPAREIDLRYEGSVVLR
ncbi:MAG: hypothetical protein A2X49_15315 [Lentisphaerae bacterium GWF2_52_8]|nr:MAG: hypothetical protein A2X49_15315 [Lentisphaerae bacterium GWF2_52_8]